MKRLVAVLSVLSVFFLLVFGSSAVAQPAATTFVGNVTIGASPAPGAVLDVFNGSNSAPFKSLTIGSQQGLTVEWFNYSVVAGCDNTSTLFLKLWGINGSARGCVFGQEQTANITVSLVANGASCSYANACSGGYCCSEGANVNSSSGSGTCKATSCSAITIPGFSLSRTSLTTAQTVNFTVNLSATLNNVTAANFTLNTTSGVISRNFTISINSRNLNISYEIFAASTVNASAGVYNISSIQVSDNGSNTNLTTITTMNFTVTAVPGAAADTGGGGAGAGAGGAAGGPAPKPTTEPTQETIDVIKEALPATFQEAAAAGNVEYKTVAAPEVKEVPVAADTVSKTLEQVATVVKTEEAKQAVAEIQQAISSGGGGTTLSVKKTIEVVKATNKVTGEAVTVSVVKLSVSAPADKALKNVEVVEVIPKAVANNVNQVSFKGEKPVVLQADPVVKWAFAEIPKGQKKDMSYAVNKDISNLNTNTIAISKKAEEAAAAPPAPPAAEKEEKVAPVTEVKKPTPLNTVVMVVVLAIVVVAGWFFLKGRKKVMK